MMAKCYWTFCVWIRTFVSYNPNTNGRHQEVHNLELYLTLDTTNGVMNICNIPRHLDIAMDDFHSGETHTTMKHLPYKQHPSWICLLGGALILEISHTTLLRTWFVSKPTQINDQRPKGIFTLHFLLHYFLSIGVNLYLLIAPLVCSSTSLLLI